MWSPFVKKHLKNVFTADLRIGNCLKTQFVHQMAFKCEFRAEFRSIFCFGRGFRIRGQNRKIRQKMEFFHQTAFKCELRADFRFIFFGGVEDSESRIKIEKFASKIELFHQIHLNQNSGLIFDLFFFN